jgi:hypothetical protein
MPTYLVPAMLRVEANSVEKADEFAADAAVFINSCSDALPVSLYLDEGLPTIKVKDAAEWEFPHSMLDEEICHRLFYKD